MNKHIRPITAYKKANPEYYEFVNSQTVAVSPKGKENEWYWWYGYFILIGRLQLANYPPSFFWSTLNTKANIGTVTEIGRLFLTGWYYGNEADNLTKDTAKYVYKAWEKKKRKGVVFNDLEFTKVVKKIRENLVYYLYNPDELKFFILESFFKDELTPLLPEPPKELKQHDDAVKFINDLNKNWLKKDKDYFKNEVWFYASYIYYLTGLLEDSGIPCSSEDEYRKQDEDEGQRYAEEIAKIRAQYKDQVKLLTIKFIPQ